METDEASDLTENQVVTFVSEWLEGRGFRLTQPPKYDRQSGDDISVISEDGRQVFVECKGSVSQAGGRLHDWQCAAMAVFGAIKETEEKRPEDLHGIAVPDTAAYRTTLGALDDFFVRQKIALFWVKSSGDVRAAGAFTELFSPPG